MDFTQFVTDQAGTISGQASMVVKGKLVGNETLLAERNHTVDFDVKNIRILNDTLVFQFDNQLLSLTGRKFNGNPSKRDNGFIIDERMTLMGRMVESICYAKAYFRF